MRQINFIISLFFALTLSIGQVWGDVVVTLDNIGAGLGSSANATTATTDITATGTTDSYTLNYYQCKKQGNAIFLTKSVNPFISNKTEMPGNIKSVKVFINSGASGKTTYDCAFSTTEVTSATSGIGAVNITGGNSNEFSNLTNNTINVKGKFFCITLGNANNGQVLKLEITCEDAGGDVIKKTLKSITISGQTTNYDTGDVFAFDGTCTATYSVIKNDVAQADEEKTVTPTSVSSPDMTTAGEKEVTISFTDGGVTKSTSYSINVVAATKSRLVFAKSYASGGATADDGAVWTVESDGSESSFDNTKGIHYGTGSAAVGHIQLSTDDIKGTITKIVVNASGASGTSAQISVTVGNSKFTFNNFESPSITSTASDFAFIGSASGMIVIAISQTSTAKALYCKSVVVTYEEAEPAAVEAPSIDGIDNFLSSTEVTITCETDGATIYYTTDATAGAGDPSTSSPWVAYNSSNKPSFSETTTIYAAAKKGDDWSEKAEKTFTKLVPKTTAAELRNLATSSAQNVHIKLENWKVTFVSGSNAYIIDPSNEGAIIYNENHGYSAGDVLNDEVVEASVKLSSGRVQLSGFTSSTITATAGSITPTEISDFSTLSASHQSRLVTLKNATYYSNNGTFSDGTNSIYYYDQFKVSPTLVNEGVYDVTGIIIQYKTSNTEKLQIAPRTADDVIAQQTVVVPTAANLAALKAAERDTYILTLTNAVVTYVNGNNAFIEEGESGALIFFSNHGYAAGDCLNGDYQVTTADYKGKFEITAMEAQAGATKTTATVPVTTLTIAQLNTNFAAYESRRIKIEGVTVTDALTTSDRNGEISDGTNTLALYAGINNTIAVAADSYIDIIGYPGFNNSDQQLTIWANADITEAEQPEVAVASVTLDETATVEVGATVTLTATIAPSNATNKTINWSVVSGDDKASVVNGVVTGLEAGEAVIRATSAADNTKYADCTVTVTEAAPLSPYATTYTSNVELSANSTNKCYSEGVTINTVDYSGLRIATGSAVGSATITVPAHTTKLHFHVAGWKGVSGSISVKLGESTLATITLIADDGINQTNGNTAPYSLANNPVGYYSNVSIPDSETPTEIEFSAPSGKRAVIFGVNQEGGVLPELASIAISGDLTNKTGYKAGDELDLTGLTVNATYTLAGTPQTPIDITDQLGEALTITYNTIVEGQTSVELTATFEGKTATKTISGLEVASADPKFVVLPDEDINFGKVEQGESVTSEVINVTLINIDAATLTLAGDGAVAFSIDKTALTASGDVTITPNTANVGNFTATLTISDDAAGVEDKVINITMRVAAPRICDREDDINTTNTDNSTSYNARSTTDGWAAENTAIKVNDDVTYWVINGKTSAIGVITSPELNGGLGKLTFDYFYSFNESNGISFKVEIKQNGSVVKTENITDASAVKDQVYTATIENINAEGKFQIVFTNLCPTGKSNGNADRYAIGNICWTKYGEPTFDEVRSGLDISRFYTACLAKKIVAIKGASVWGISKRNDAGSMAYLEEMTAPIAAGTPFIYFTTAGTFEVAYEGEEVSEPIENGALRGTLSYMDADALETAGSNIYLMYQNALHPLGTNNHLDANRAYLVYGALEIVSETPAPAPGRRVRKMPMQENVTTDIKATEVSDKPTKVMIDGQLFILRGEKLYDTTGRQVK